MRTRKERSEREGGREATRPALSRELSKGRKKTHLVLHGVDVVVPRKDGELGSPLDERPEDVGLGSEVEDGDVNVSLGVENVRLGGRSLRDQVLLARIPVVSNSRASLRDLLLSDSDPSESGSLIPEEGGDGSSVDSADSRNSVSVAPLVEGLDGEVVGVLEGDVGDDDS